MAKSWIEILDEEAEMYDSEFDFWYAVKNLADERMNEIEKKELELEANCCTCLGDDEHCDVHDDWRQRKLEEATNEN